MERTFADVKVLWSNICRDVRTLYISMSPHKDTYFSYRLLATLSKYKSELDDLDDLRSRFLLKVKVRRKVSEKELAHAPIPLSLNILSRIVSRNPDMALSVYAVRGFRNPRLLSAAIIFSKSAEWNEVGMRSLLIIQDPDTSISQVKKGANRLARFIWSDVKKRILLSAMKYSSVAEALIQYPILGVILISTRPVSVEEIRAVVSDGSEYREVKIPVKMPSWTLSDLPHKIIEDIEVAIVKPVKSGMKFATKGAFITGPPGVGKSVMSEALASALGLKIVELRPQTYRSMWYGATEKMLNAIFHQIIKKRKEIALVIDDAEFISSRKYTIHEAHISEISTILYHLQRPDRPFTVLTANNPDLIDPAILRPGRIDVTIVLGYPDRNMRKRALLKHIQMYGIKIDEKCIDMIVDITRWYSLAEVDAFVRLAAGKGNGKIGPDEITWAKKKFNVIASERNSMQDYLRWWANKAQGIVITYIPHENEI